MIMSFLTKHTQVTVLSTTCINRVSEESLPATIDTKTVLQYSNDFWVIYYYDRLKDVQPYFGQDLKRWFNEYQTQYPKLWPQPSYRDDRHLVIHYRCGDFLLLGLGLQPSSLVQAIDFTPSHISIMDGGMTWETPEDAFNPSQLVIQHLQKLLQARFPQVSIDRVPQGSVDGDLHLLLRAPCLLTAGGSFAMAAALMHTGPWCRTPAVDCMNWPQIDPRPPRKIAESGHENWYTYSCQPLNRTKENTPAEWEQALVT